MSKSSHGSLQVIYIIEVCTLCSAHLLLVYCMYYTDALCNLYLCLDPAARARHLIYRIVYITDGTAPPPPV